MVLEQLSPYFLNPFGILALLSIIPLLIIYLKKPKPKKVSFPALEFIMSREKQQRTLSWLSKILEDPLFLLQLLILVLISAAAAYPYMMVSQSVAADQVVVIIDSSGSMQTRYEGSTRFEAAKKIAIDSLGSVNTVIMASDFPEVLVEGADKGEATRLIKDAKPKATSSNLYDALILGDDFLADQEGKVVLVSDFLHNANSKKLSTARKVLESKGISVVYKPVYSKARNVGIIETKISQKEVEVKIRNYDSQPVSLQVTYLNETKSVSMAGLETVSATFAKQKGEGSVKIIGNDDFDLDNVAYVNVPEGAAINAVMLTNQESRYIGLAFSLIDGVKLEKLTLPVSTVPEADLYIFAGMDENKLLPGTVQEIAQRVRNGASAIIVAQKPMPKILEQEFGFSVNNRVQSTANVGKIDSELLESIDFGTATEFYNATGLSELAFAQDGNSSVTLIGTKKLGDGKVLYYGLEEKYSSFHFELMYPVFWKRLLDNFFGKIGTAEANYKSGAIVSFDGFTEVKHPSGITTSSKSLELDEAGFYRFEGKTIAVNMDNEKESDINGELFEQDADVAIASHTSERQVPFDLTAYFAAIVAGLVLLELVVVKYRGDL